MLWRIFYVNSNLIIESISQRGLHFLEIDTKKTIVFHAQGSSSVGLLVSWAESQCFPHFPRQQNALSQWKQPSSTDMVFLRKN